MKFLGERYGVVREWLKTFTRDGSWVITREAYIEKFDRCECCGTTKDLNVHHIHPSRWYPQLELEPYNLITLCRKHHFRIGHLGNWKYWNPYVWEMAQLYQKGILHFETEYERYAVNKETPDYEYILKELKRSQGRIIQIGNPHDFRTKTKNLHKVNR